MLCCINPINWSVLLLSWIPFIFAGIGILIAIADVIGAIIVGIIAAAILVIGGIFVILFGLFFILMVIVAAAFFFFALFMACMCLFSALCFLLIYFSPTICMYLVASSFICSGYITLIPAFLITILILSSAMIMGSSCPCCSVGIWGIALAIISSIAGPLFLIGFSILCLGFAASFCGSIIFLILICIFTAPCWCPILSSITSISFILGIITIILMSGLTSILLVGVVLVFFFYISMRLFAKTTVSIFESIAAFCKALFCSSLCNVVWNTINELFSEIEICASPLEMTEHFSRLLCCEMWCNLCTDVMLESIYVLGAEPLGTGKEY
jgi:hypothetical protein